jgi:hypothetical protein
MLKADVLSDLQQVCDNAPVAGPTPSLHRIVIGSSCYFMHNKSALWNDSFALCKITENARFAEVLGDDVFTALKVKLVCSFTYFISTMYRQQTIYGSQQQQCRMFHLTRIM